jgi:hypothetical protein
MKDSVTKDSSSNQAGKLSRRSFLKAWAAAPALAAGGGRAVREGIRANPLSRDTKGMVQASPAGAPGADKFVAIQVGAVSFVDEGVDKVLDILQQQGGVNALMLAVFTYGRGIAGRQVPGQPLPDHGAQQYDTDSFHGGSYAAVHAQYYSGPVFKDFRAPDVGDFDVLEEVIPKAKARGIASFCWLEDVYNARFIPSFEKVAEVDLYGRLTGEACLNNPDTRGFLGSLVEDYAKSYPIDGLMWGSERQGPLNNAIGSRHGVFRGSASITCFCEHCRKKAAERGISVDRARLGFVELDNFVRSARNGHRPADGYFVTFWRLLLNYPEILAWEKLWTDSQHEIYGVIYGTVKSINPRARVGWHIWHNNSFSPFFRAEQDYSKLSQNSDFLKVVIYNNCGGPRMVEYARNIQSTILRDLSPEEVLAFNYEIMGYEKESGLDRLATTGLSANYVARETKRAMAGVGPDVAIYPGIDIDIPTGVGQKKTRPEDVKAAVSAAFEAGAPGVVLSRKYSEMRLENLAAAGAAVSQVGGRRG